jgi:hypothetical protein
MKFCICISPFYPSVLQVNHVATPVFRSSDGPLLANSFGSQITKLANSALERSPHVPFAFVHCTILESFSFCVGRC